MMAVWLQQLVKEKNAADVLYHHNNMVTEFPRANFFMVTNKDILVTAANNILEGITRKKILELAKDFIKAEVRDISMNELMHAKEAFLSSTTRRILPVVKIEDHLIGNGQPGNITKQLYHKLLETERSILV